MNPLTKELKEYLKNATPEQIKKDWEDLKHTKGGISADEFVKKALKKD